MTASGLASANIDSRGELSVPHPVSGVRRSPGDSLGWIFLGFRHLAVPDPPPLGDDYPIPFHATGLVVLAVSPQRTTRLDPFQPIIVAKRYLYDDIGAL